MVEYDSIRRAPSDRAAERVSADGSPLERLKASYLEWTRTVRAPDIAQILFEIGPSALGEAKSKEIEARAANPPIKRLLALAMDEGEIAPPDEDLLVALLNALVGEAALYQLHTGSDPLPTLEVTFTAIFAGMRA